jgi:hypothetical protein
MRNNIKQGLLPRMAENSNTNQQLKHTNLTVKASFALSISIALYNSL